MLESMLSWLANQADQMGEDLIHLCDHNSGSDHVQGLLATANWLEHYFSSLEVPCSRQSLEPYSLVDDSGIVSNFETGPVLRWELGPPDAPAFLWTIHYDTVYGKNDPFQACERLDQGRLRGPGVIDAKGGIVVMRYAAMAAKQFLSWERNRLTLILTPDEEIGSPASLPMWRSIARDFRGAFLFEPTLADGSLVQARKGTGTFAFVVRGKAAHAVRNFHEGRNAIIQACKIAADCDRLNGQRPTVTVNVGRIRGGNAVNVVPDTAVVRVNVRIASIEDQRWIESQCQQIADLHHQPGTGFRIELHGGISAPPKTLDADTELLQRAVERASKQLKLDLRWKESGGASDGNKLQSLGLANLDTFGPRGDGLHSDQEWVELGSLAEKSSLTIASYLQAIGELV